MPSPWPRPSPVPLPPLYAANPATAHLRAAEIRLASIHCKITVDDIVGPIHGLIIGEAPGPTGRLPMFPYPPQSSGGRLRSMSGLTVGQYLGRLRRIDLSMNPDPKSWNRDEARAEAARVRQLLSDDLAWRRSTLPEAEPLRVVLCGARVAAAFGVEKPLTMPPTIIDEHPYVAIPHPSGRNRTYDDERIRIAAGIAVRWSAGYL